MKFAKKGLLLLSMIVLAGIGAPHYVWATKDVSGTDEKEEVFVASSEVTETEVTETEITETEITELETPDKNVKPVRVPKISRTAVQIKAGKTTKLSVSNFNGKVKWSSLKTDIAKVTKDGRISAKAPGETVIIAKAGKKQLKCKVCVVAQTKNLSTWVERNGRAYYFDKYGVKTVGKKSIDGKDYFFDEEGRQRVGWVKSKGKYYYYNIAKKSKGYRVTGKKVNGIRLAKTGEAILTSDTKDKVKYLTEANDLCFDYVNFNMTKNESLKKMYTLLCKGEIISYRNYGGFKNSKNWDLHYASYYFNQGIGDCYTTGVAFAYMATALGFEDVYAVSSGGHGWCKIGDKYYDPNWGWWGARNMYDSFGSSGSAIGKDGKTMNWKKFSKYLKKVS